MNITEGTIIIPDYAEVNNDQEDDRQERRLPHFPILG